ncbi:MAG: FadR/GntR family transcriptional regulator [Thermomicrobiales bacterium]
MTQRDTADRTRFVTREELAHGLEEEIVSGVRAVGSRLPSERELSEQFGVSRPIVREALRSLVERRLVEIHPGRGAYVRSIQSSDAASHMSVVFRRQQVTARDLVEARSMLECTAAELAASRADQADIDVMARMAAELENAGDLVLQARYDLSFHYSVIRAARNPVVETMFAAIVQPTVEVMLRSLIDEGVRAAALSLHNEIVDAIRQHQPARARDAMEQHILVAEHLYGEDLDRSLESVARRELARTLAPSITLESVLEQVATDFALVRQVEAPNDPSGEI